jgi:hypothetical protein
MNNITKEIGRIFQFSNSQDELFDNFRVAIERKIKDLALYNALLWNKTLSVDEILMFAEKICKEIPEFSFNIYLTVAKILDTNPQYENKKEIAFGFIKKAAASDHGSIEPYIIISEMYDEELNIPPLEQVADFFENGFRYVKERSKLSFLLAKLYGKTGDIETGKKYQKRGEEYLENGE